MRLGRAGIEHAEQNTLAAFDADGLAGTQHLPVDREQPVIDVALHFRAEERLPVMQNDGELGVVTRRVVARLDDCHAKLPGVRADVRILTGHGVGVIPARARGIRGERVAPGVVGLDMGRAFFVRAIHLRRNVKPVPVDEFGTTRLVHDVDRHQSCLPVSAAADPALYRCRPASSRRDHCPGRR